MQGNCTEAAPPAEVLDTAHLQPPLLPLQPGQCVLLADANLITAWHHLWLDGLYVRHTPSARAPSTANILGGHSSHGASALYLSHSTLQGAVLAERSTAHAVRVDERNTSAESSASQLPPKTDPVDVTGAALGSLAVDVADSLYAEGALCLPCRLRWPRCACVLVLRASGCCVLPPGPGRALGSLLCVV